MSGWVKGPESRIVAAFEEHVYGLKAEEAFCRCLAVWGLDAYRGAVTRAVAYCKSTGQEPESRRGSLVTAAYAMLATMGAL